MAYGIQKLKQYLNEGSERREDPEVRQLARQGVGGDTVMAHLTPGEMVVPKDALSGLEPLIYAQLAKQGYNPEEYMVSSQMANQNRNPFTGAQQFAGKGMSSREAREAREGREARDRATEGRESAAERDTTDRDVSMRGETGAERLADTISTALGYGVDPSGYGRRAHREETWADIESQFARELGIDINAPAERGRPTRDTALQARAREAAREQSLERDWTDPVTGKTYRKGEQRPLLETDPMSLVELGASGLEGLLGYFGKVIDPEIVGKEQVTDPVTGKDITAARRKGWHFGLSGGILGTLLGLEKPGLVQQGEYVHPTEVMAGLPRERDPRRYEGRDDGQLDALPWWKRGEQQAPSGQGIEALPVAEDYSYQPTAYPIGLDYAQLGGLNEFEKILYPYLRQRTT